MESMASIRLNGQASHLISCAMGSPLLADTVLCIRRTQHLWVQKFTFVQQKKRLRVVAVNSNNSGKEKMGAGRNAVRHASLGDVRVPGKNTQDTDEQQPAESPSTAPADEDGSAPAESSKIFTLSSRADSTDELRAAEAKRRSKRQAEALERAIQGRAVFGSGLLGTLSFTVREVSRLLLGIEREDLQDLRKLDIAAMMRCFSYTDFWAVSSQPYGNGAIFVGNLRGPIQEVGEKLTAKLRDAAGCDVELFFLYDDNTGQQVCVVQPAVEVLQNLKSRSLSGIGRWPLAFSMAAATVYSTLSVANISFYGAGGADSASSRALMFAIGLLSVVGAGEIASRFVAHKYGVKLSPPYAIPAHVLGCNGVATRIESPIPSRAALFDIAAARSVASFGAALLLAAASLVLSAAGGGDGPNTIYVEPALLEPNLLLSLLQSLLASQAGGGGAAQGASGAAGAPPGVPMEPLAVAALLGMLMTSLNLLPAGQLEGGRIVQAMLGRKVAKEVSAVTITVLCLVGVLGKSALPLVFAVALGVFRRGQELPTHDEISALDPRRSRLGWALLGGAILMLLPHHAAQVSDAFGALPGLDDF